MPSYMYILECADGSYYTGSTKNLEKRLWQHQNGEGAIYTQEHLLVKLVYCEPYERVADVFWREKQVQGWSRRKKQALIAGDYDKLVEFSKNYTEHGKPFPKPVEGIEGNSDVLQDPAAVSTSSTSAYMVDDEHKSLPINKPLTEPVEGSGGLDIQDQLNGSEDPAAVSTSSTSAYMVDDEHKSLPTNKPLTESVEGSGGRGKQDPAAVSTSSTSAYTFPINKQTYKPPKKEKSWKQK